MSKDTLKKQIKSMTRHVRRRLWLQRFVRWSGVMLALTFAIAIILVFSHLSLVPELEDQLCECIDPVYQCTWNLIKEPIQCLWFLLALPWVLGAFITCPWKLDAIEFAKAIDIANDLKEALSSALAFLREDKTTPWMNAHIASTEKLIERDDTRSEMCKKTFAIQRPQYLKWAGIAAVVSILPFTMYFTNANIHNYLLPNPNADACDWTDVLKEQNNHDVDENKPAFDKNIDDATHTLREEQVQELMELAKTSDDEELKKAADELNKILEEDKNGELSADEFKKRLDALQNKLAQSDPAPQEQQEHLDQTLAQALEELTQMKEDPETKQLADALEEKKYDEAAQILKDLLNSTDPKDKKKLEKLAKMFGDLANKLDMTDPELREALQKNQDLVNQLEKQLAQNGKLTDEEKKAFKDAKKRLDDAQKQQEQNQDPASKSTQQLQKAFDKTAQDLKNKAQNETPSTPSDDSKNPNPENASQGEQQSQEGIEKPSSEGDPAQKNAQMGNQQQGADDALQKEAQNRENQAKRDKLQDLANKMKQDAAQNNASGDKQTQADKQERAENMEDFLERAKGNEGSKSKKQKDEAEKQNQENQQNAQQQNAQQQNSQQQNSENNATDQAQTQAQQGSQEQPSSEQNEMKQGEDKPSAQQQGQMGQQSSGQQNPGMEQDSQQGQKDGIGQDSNQQGGHSESEGEKTQMDIKTVDEKLQGQASNAPTTSEIIQSSGQTGFATEAYREVYQTYEHAAEEILENDSVPQGYRHYIEKYFDMIRPQN